MIKKLMVLFLFSISLVYADEVLESDGLRLLEKMKTAMKVLNYQGTVAFMKNGQLDTMKYFHAVNNGSEQERLLSLNSPMREVVRDSDKVSCTFKATHKRVVNHRPVSQSFILDFPKDLVALTDVYSFSVLGEESVAMKASWLVSVLPKDDFRYSRKIWIDKQNFLPLKVEVYSLAGTTLEQVVFTDISVKKNIPFVNLDDHQSRLNIKHIHQAKSDSFENVPFELNNLPAGFDKVFFSRVSMHQSVKPVDHLLLSDGFSSVSVYLDQEDEETVYGLQTLGSVNSFTRIQNGTLIVVLGEVPAKTVKYIADGIVFRK